ATLVQREAPGAAFAVLPADHAIDDRAAFVADLERALAAAERERLLLTFGIRPASPQTVFGYLQRGARIGEGVFRVAAFTEKPSRPRAEEFVKQGGYFWNAGIFAWRADVFLDALQATRPGLAAAIRPLSTADDFD